MLAGGCLPAGSKKELGERGMGKVRGTLTRSPLTSGHAYPKDLVAFIYERWQDEAFVARLCPEAEECSFQLPDRGVLEQVISTCY